MSLVPSANDPIVRIPHCLADDVRVLEEKGAEQGAYRSMFEEWSGKVPLVKMVLQGETTFTESYDLIVDALGGAKGWYPVSYPEQYKSLIDDLGKTVAMIGTSENDVLVGNFAAFTGGCIAVTPVAIPVVAICKRRMPTRRDFLEGMCATGVFGATTGTLASLTRMYHFSSQRENAEYLDQKVTEMYRF